MIFWFVVILVIGVILISMIGIFWGRPQRWDTRRRRTLFGSSFNRETIAAESINIIAQEQQRHHVRHMHHSGSRGAERPSSPQSGSAGAERPSPHPSGSWGTGHHVHHHSSSETPHQGGGFSGGGGHHGGGHHG